MASLMNEPKKAYLQLAVAIETMQMKSMLNQEEKVSLQNLLDLTSSAEHAELFEALGYYVSLPRNEHTKEVDEIIKATLASTDLNNTSNIHSLIQLIVDLTGEKVRLLEHN
ncbi:MAG: hypothetical protein ACM3PP_08045 [Candidatus Saccharibacteria bacterium]